MAYASADSKSNTANQIHVNSLKCQYVYYLAVNEMKLTF